MHHLVQHRRIGAGILAVFVLALSLVLSPLTGAQSTPEPGETDHSGTLTVQGIGTVQVDPDTARLDLGVLANNESLEVAQTEVSEGLANITQVLTDAGVAAEDITTSSYNVYPVPEYDRDGNYVGVSRYEVSSGVTVIVRDIESVGTILDAAVNAGANNVWGISFYVEDPSDAAAEARGMAVEDARARADQLATASGSVITHVISISETSSPTPMPKDYYAGMGGAEMDSAAAAMPVPVSPGQADITVTVQVIFGIEPANG